MRLPLNERFFGNMEAIDLPYQTILFWKYRSSLKNIFRSWIISAINEAMVKRSVDLRCILVNLFFVIFVEIMEVDRVWAESEVIERGDADILVHGDLWEDKLWKRNISWNRGILYIWFFWKFSYLLSNIICCIIISIFYKMKIFSLFFIIIYKDGIVWWCIKSTILTCYNIINSWDIFFSSLSTNRTFFTCISWINEINNAKLLVYIFPFYLHNLYIIFYTSKTWD